jgi:hypothetical protein
MMVYTLGKKPKVRAYGSSPPSRVRRFNTGQTRLTHRSPRPRTRGRRMVMVPLVQLSPRG